MLGESGTVCVECYRLGRRGEDCGQGERETVYGRYCAACYDRNRASLRDAARSIADGRMQYLRSLSEMGERFEDRTFANYRQSLQNRQAYVAAQAAWEDRGGLYLYGPSGNGKTHLAAAIVNAAISAGVEAIFVTGVGLLQRIRESYRRSQQQVDSERSILARYADVPVLALDDLGTEPFTVDTGRLFYALINRRYERNLRLVVTSNLDLAALMLQWRKSGVETHVGDKIGDRIREMCDNRIVKIDAPSKRGEIRNEGRE